MKKDHSFGIIPFFKKEKGEIEYLLIKHLSGHWGFPKGHKESGESDIETAKREFCEETGICDFQIVNERPFVTETYKTYHPELKNVEKTVFYFLAQVFEKDFDLPPNEISDAKWCPAEKAEETLTHERTKEILREANDFVVSNT